MSKCLGGIVTENDLKEAIKLERRKQYEEDRKQRIFNAKQRLFGLDMAALENQIHEKAKQRAKEKDLEHSFHLQMNKMQSIIKAKDLELENRRRAAESDLNYNRCHYQRPEQRREFDLNDPNAKRNSKPVRTGDNDINLGASSAQIFAGEDLGHKERTRRQREQQRSWLTQQIIEKRKAKESQRTADQMLYQSIQSVDKRLEDMAQSETKTRKNLIDNIRQYNMELAKSKKEERERKKREKNEDDRAEIYNMLTSDMLTENPDVAQSRIHPKKKIAFMYRGMTAEELAAFRKEQRQQLIERNKQHSHQLLMDKQWEQHLLNADRELCLKDIEVEKQRRHELQKLIEFNRVLAKEQKLAKEQANIVLNTNKVSPEFYDQFNRSTR